VIAIIPARGGSRRVPRKNLRLVGGRPLIAWTIEAAKTARSVDRVVVTTDDREIADVSKREGAEVPFIRPAALSTDTATSVDVVAHALGELGVNPTSDSLFVLLQPTSPLRTGADIDAAAALLSTGDAVVSVTPVAHPVQWLRTIGTDGFLQPWLESDKTREPLYELNGAIYLMSSRDFHRERQFLPPRTAPYVMPRERSIDIDTEFDLHLCDLILSAHEAHV
jgi:N-acylneuraminate cytidylyltransferase/CMP-N,N'-diacetyllegionaminic acid synthase